MSASVRIVESSRVFNEIFPPVIAELIDGYTFEMKNEIFEFSHFPSEIKDLFLLEESGLVVVCFLNDKFQLWDPVDTRAIGMTVDLRITIHSYCILPGDLLAIVYTSDDPWEDHGILIYDPIRKIKLRDYVSEYELEPVLLPLPGDRLAVIQNKGIDCEFLLFDLTLKVFEPTIEVFEPLVHPESFITTNHAVVITDGRIIVNNRFNDPTTGESWEELRFFNIDAKEETDNDEDEEPLIQVEGEITYLKTLSGDRLVVLTGELKITILDIDSDLKLSFDVGPIKVENMTILLDETIVTLHIDGEIKRWNQYNGELIESFIDHSHHPHYMLSLPDGNILSGDETNIIALWS